MKSPNEENKHVSTQEILESLEQIEKALAQIKVWAMVMRERETNEQL